MRIKNGLFWGFLTSSRIFLKIGGCENSDYIRAGV